MWGAIIGDIVGSIYEFNNHRSKRFPLFGPGVEFTDDSVMTIAVADALLNGRHPATAMKDWGRRYPGRGYGGRFARWLESADDSPYNSYGNGAAMRVSPAAHLVATLDEALTLAERVTAVTHNHPEGLKGAAATVHAIVLAREKVPAADIRSTIAATYGYDMNRTVDGIRPIYRFNETCQETVPEALICAFEATDFEDAIRNAISIGGDSDTVAAIAGAVAEAMFGVPEAILKQARGYLTDDLVAVMGALYARHTHKA
jgi:ADP-ribosyl-[dinitrogen reductase] hydrolase